MTDEPTCVCLGVKASLATALRGRAQPECPQHPRDDDGERERQPLALNKNRDLKAAIMTDLNNGTDAA